MIETLKKRDDFLRLGRSGESWVSKTVVIQRAPFPEKSEKTVPQSRFGFTVTRKTFKRAVDRNRTKRRLRAALRQILQEASISTAATSAGVNRHYDYVLIGRQDTLSCDWPALLRDLRWCFRRIETKPPSTTNVVKK